MPEKRTKKTRAAAPPVNTSDGINWAKYDELLASGMDAEDAMAEAKIKPE